MLVSTRFLSLCCICYTAMRQLHYLHPDRGMFSRSTSKVRCWARAPALLLETTCVCTYVCPDNLMSTSRLGCSSLKQFAIAGWLKSDF